MKRARDQITTLNVEWVLERGGWSIGVDEAGAVMPPQIRLALINHLLHDLKPSDYRVGLQESR